MRITALFFVAFWTVVAGAATRPALFSMRFDDNHDPAQWRQVADIFERQGVPLSFAVVSSSLSDEQGACLKELSQRGHEVMDHTAQHAFYQLDYRRDAAAFAAHTNAPFAAEWDSAKRTVLCRPEIDWNHRSALKFRGSVRNGELMTADATALKRLHFTAKFYVPSAKKWFGIAKVDGERRFVKDFWGRPVADTEIPETEMVVYGQAAIQPGVELMRVQAELSRANFDRFGIRRPTFWIQPGGWEAFLDGNRLEKVMGGEFGYLGADAVVGAASGASRWFLRPSFAYFDEGRDLEEVKRSVREGLAKNGHFIFISHMSSARAGGWEKWIENTESFAKWLKESGITCVTHSELACRRFGNPPAQSFKDYANKSLPSISVEWSSVAGKRVVQRRRN